MPGPNAPTGSLLDHVQRATRRVTNGLARPKQQLLSKAAADESEESSSDSDENSSNTDNEVDRKAVFDRLNSTSTAPKSASSKENSEPRNGKPMRPAAPQSKKNDKAGELVASNAASTLSNNASAQRNTKLGATEKDSPAKNGTNAPNDLKTAKKSNTKSNQDSSDSSSTSSDSESESDPESEDDSEYSNDNSSSDKDSDSSSSDSDSSEDTNNSKSDKAQLDNKAKQKQKAQSPQTFSQSGSLAKPNGKQTSLANHGKSRLPVPKLKSNGGAQSEGDRISGNKADSTSSRSPPEVISAGFHLRKASDGVDASDVIQFLENAKLEGKQVWYFTAPASIPITVVEQLEVPLDQAMSGQTILSHKGEDYNVAFEDVTINSSVKLLIPNAAGDEYSAFDRQMDRTFHLKRVTKFSSTTLANSVSTAPPEPRAQPAGVLKMRNYPIGIAQPPPRNLELDKPSSSCDQGVETTPAHNLCKSSRGSIKKPAKTVSGLAAPADKGKRKRTESVASTPTPSEKVGGDKRAKKARIHPSPTPLSRPVKETQIAPPKVPPSFTPLSVKKLTAATDSPAAAVAASSPSSDKKKEKKDKKRSSRLSLSAPPTTAAKPSPTSKALRPEDKPRKETPIAPPVIPVSKFY